MSDEFTIEEHSRAGRHQLVLTGELDLAAAYDLEAALSRVFAEGSRQVDLDLRGVTFMDSMGLRSLLVAKDMCHNHGAELAVIPNPALHKIFEVTGMLDVLPWQGETG